MDRTNIHHRNEATWSLCTYRFLGNFPNVVGDADTLRVLFKEFLGGSGVDILDEQGVFGGELGSQVSRHGVALTDVSTKTKSCEHRLAHPCARDQ